MDSLPAGLEFVPIEDDEKFVRHQDGIAIVFAERYKNLLKYCHHADKWYHWSGNRWTREETKLAFHWARELCRSFNKRRPDSTIAFGFHGGRRRAVCASGSGFRCHV